MKTFIEIRNLSKIYQQKNFFGKVFQEVIACNQINLDIFEGETMALVGESGSGKSTLGKMILGLETPSSGEIVMNGEILKEDRIHDPNYYNSMQVIFQDPMASLNPAWSAKKLVAEPLMNSHSRLEAYKEALRILDLVGIKAEEASKLPREFSGGQRQRIGIARSIVTNPDFIVCDEPVSALDVSIQSTIINLLLDLQSERNLTYLFISHDLSVVRSIADRIAVMYKGRIVELGNEEDIYENPQHPYTIRLLNAIPVPDPHVSSFDNYTFDDNFNYDGELVALSETHFVIK